MGSRPMLIHPNARVPWCREFELHATATSSASAPIRIRRESRVRARLSSASCSSSGNGDGQGRGKLERVAGPGGDSRALACSPAACPRRARGNRRWTAGPRWRRTPRPSFADRVRGPVRPGRGGTIESARAGGASCLCPPRPAQEVRHPRLRASSAADLDQGEKLRERRRGLRRGVGQRVPRLRDLPDRLRLRRDLRGRVARVQRRRRRRVRLSRVLARRRSPGGGDRTGVEFPPVKVARWRFRRESPGPDAEADDAVEQ